MSFLNTSQSFNLLNEALEQVSHWRILNQVCSEEDIPLFLVGGAVRDMLLRQVLSSDLDVVVPQAQAKTLAQAVAQRAGGKYIPLDEHYQIYRIVFPGQPDMMDIAGCMGESIEVDLGRRDLTVNAVAVDVKGQRVFDPYDGIRDLAHGIIRMVRPENMVDDPLRLLRVFRMSAELGFTKLDPRTLGIVSLEAHRVVKIAPERVHYELMRLLSAPKCSTPVQLMAKTGMLEYLFPELSAMHPIPSNYYHHLGLFDHTLELLHQAEVHFPDLPTQIQTDLHAAFNPFIKRIALVRLACLFHDAGKSATMAYDPDTDRYRFYGHEQVSEALTWGIAYRFRWGNDLTRAVAHLVRWHLYPGDQVKETTTTKAKRRFFRRIGPLLPEMMLLAIADRYSAQGEGVTQDDLINFKKGILALWDLYESDAEVHGVMPRLLTGQDIMERFHISPGPIIGRVQAAAQEAYLEGKISTRDEALKWLEKQELACFSVSC